MAATKQDIIGWLNQGKSSNATHMIVVCDTYDYDDYPVYVHVGENVESKIRSHQGNMQKVMEVYSYALPLESQLNERRAYHI